MLLNYSSFMKLLKRYCTASISNEELARTIFNSFLEEDDFPTDSGLLSKIWNGEREISGNVKNAIYNSSNKKKLLECFEDVIIPEIQEPLMEDFLFNLGKLIDADETISPKKRKKLHELEDSEDLQKYLVEVFVYAVSKDNRTTIGNISSDDIELLDEVDQKCPLCNKLLIKKLKTNTIYSCRTTNIYPDNLPDEIEKDFLAVFPLDGTKDDKVNKICLCDNCHNDYVYHPTITTFAKLCRIKKQIIRNSTFSEIATAQLDSQIIEVLENLKTCDANIDLIKELRLKPLEIKNKILPKNTLLMSSIKNDNELYYNYIRDYLSQLDSYRKPFTYIALQVQICFDKLSEITDDQEEIFNKLVDWILHSQALSSNYQTAAHIVISFFVQNCEVFNEISK